MSHVGPSECREPTQIFFVCEGCQKRVKPRVIRRWAGHCRKCESESWTLLVNYSETAYGYSILGLLSGLFYSRGWFNSTTHTNQVSAAGITSDVAQKLTGQPSLVAFQVTQHLRKQETQELHDRGAQPCQTCRTLYVPVAGKPWTEQGFCSKSCAVQGGVEISALNLESSSESSGEPAQNESQTSGSQPSFTTTVKCPNGHEFEVMVSFSGLMRPCSECGAKTRVP